jgi:hypothetical protein
MTSSSRSCVAAAAGESKASSQLVNGRAPRSREPRRTVRPAASVSRLNSSGAGRPAPVWKTTRLAPANSSSNAVLPTRRPTPDEPRRRPRRLPPGPQGRQLIGG